MRMSRRAGRVKNSITQAIARGVSKGMSYKIGDTMYVQGDNGQVVRLTPKQSKGVMK